MKKLKVCIDAGHGWGNRLGGKYDPGCVRGSIEEAQLTYQYAHDVAQKLRCLGVEVYETRMVPQMPAPVWGRAAAAMREKCHALVSFHVNDAESPKANGVETWYETTRSLPLATMMQQTLVLITGFRDRGVKQHDELSAVLEFQGGPSILMELGFIDHDGNREFLVQGKNQLMLVDAIAATITHWWKEEADGLPF